MVSETLTWRMGGGWGWVWQWGWGCEGEREAGNDAVPMVERYHEAGILDGWEKGVALRFMGCL